MLQSVFIKKNLRENCYYNLSQYSYFVRSNIKEVIEVIFKNIMIDLKYTNSETIDYYSHEKIEDTYLVIYRNANIIILSICSKQINLPCLILFLKQLAIYDTWKQETNAIESFIKNYDVNLKESNKIEKINKTLDNTHKILIKNIDILLSRQQSLENLLIKSEELSISSKHFLKRTKKLNRCCVIL